MLITPELQNLFIERVTQLLEQGHQTTTVINTVRGKKTKVDGDGIIIDEVTEYRENKQVKLSPVPNWVYDFVLKQINRESAINLLESEGFVVLDPTIKVTSETEGKVGMPTETYLNCYSDFLGVDVNKVLEAEGLEIQ